VVERGADTEEQDRPPALGPADGVDEEGDAGLRPSSVRVARASAYS
jgi:hypothetical protein